MGRGNVAYVVSDNWIHKHRPNDSYLRAGKAALETYFGPPLGSHQIVYVNSLRDIVSDLSRRFGAGRERAGNLLVVLHGEVNPGAPPAERFGVKLTIDSPVRGALTQQQLEDELADFGDRLNASARTRRSLRELRQSGVDSQTTLTFLGCSFGAQQGILDAFREFLGGNLTVFAPKAYQGFRTEPVKDGFTRENTEQAVKALVGMGLLELSPDPLFRALSLRTKSAALIGQLRKVTIVHQESLVPKSLYELGYLPLLYMLPENAVDDVHANRIYPHKQRVGEHWGVSAPAGLASLPAQLQERLWRFLPAKPQQPIDATRQTPGGVRVPRGAQAPVQPTYDRRRGLAGPESPMGGQTGAMLANLAAQRRAAETRQHQQHEVQRRIQAQVGAHRQSAQDLREAQRRRVEQAAERQRDTQQRERSAQREEAQRRQAREEAERRRSREEAQRRAREEAQRRQSALDSARTRTPMRDPRPVDWARPGRRREVIEGPITLHRQGRRTYVTPGDPRFHQTMRWNPRSGLWERR